MNILVENFFKKHPRHAASLLESHSHEVFVDLLHQTEANVDQVLPYLSPKYLAQILQDYTEEAGHQLCKCMSPNLAALVLRHVKPTARAALLAKLNPTQQRSIDALIDFNPQQLGYYCQNDEITLTEEHRVKDALARIDLRANHDSLIIVISKQALLKGVVNPITLIKNRYHEDMTMGQLVSKVKVTLPGALLVKHLVHHPAWDADLKIPVVGHGYIFLGVISRSILKHQYRKQEPVKTEHNPVEDYFEFSEMIWGGLQKFWSSIR